MTSSTNRDHFHAHIGPNNQGQRLDKFLMSELSLSRTQVKRLLSAGCVRLNARKALLKAKGHVCQAGDKIKVDLSLLLNNQGDTDEIITPQYHQLKNYLIKSTPDYLFINKPAGMPVHPLKLGETDTILNAVVADYPQVQGVGEAGLKSGVVHRLDVTTSGTLAVAITQNGWDELRTAFQQHTIKKTYLALVQGQLTQPADLQAELAITTHSPAKVSVIDLPQSANINTRTCTLSYKPLCNLNHATLIEVDLGTGFLHQIRVMMANLGHPLLGDPLYQGPSTIQTHNHQTIAVNRPMLHAKQLCHKSHNISCSCPKDFDNIKKALEK